MIRRMMRAVSRMLRSKRPPTQMTDEMIRRETARATSDLANKQGMF
jgi:hypothetical protein